MKGGKLKSKEKKIREKIEKGNQRQDKRRKSETKKKKIRDKIIKKN